MEFKNLAEVTQLEEVPEGASVLAATAEGEVVRVPGDGLGGDGQLVVTFAYDNSSSDNVPTVDKTFAEIAAACEAGQRITAAYKQSGLSNACSYGAGCEFYADDGVFIATFVMFYDTMLNIMSFMVDSTGTITRSSGMFTESE